VLLTVNVYRHVDSALQKYVIPLDENAFFCVRIHSSLLCVDYKSLECFTSAQFQFRHSIKINQVSILRFSRDIFSVRSYSFKSDILPFFYKTRSSATAEEPRDALC